MTRERLNKVMLASCGFLVKTEGAPISRTFHPPAGWVLHWEHQLVPCEFLRPVPVRALSVTRASFATDWSFCLVKCSPLAFSTLCQWGEKGRRAE